ncbi:LADA_0B08020g1_1 [Lachancea dasiensis]|uniref:tRNA pseudouridine(32) synthase n=1 Tax=Lachancea dasiensis TaxID=1072105 RepID=A0A1G4IUA0_9SACH|nr:LADA_0B08020g1_1 [Lachancea dasiensis]
MRARHAGHRLLNNRRRIIVNWACWMLKRCTKPIATINTTCRNIMSNLPSKTNNDELVGGHDCKKRSSSPDGRLEEVQTEQNVSAPRLRNKKTKNGQPGELRDSSGFKIKIQESNHLRNKQVDPPYEVKIDGPLRKIVPYLFTYKTFCKLRWRDRLLIDIFVNEFRDREEAYYRKTIASGSVLLNDVPANLESVVRNGDLISHNIHRHEPPVTSRPIKIVFEDQDILVIDKPSGIPVHPTGRYRFNTITKILQKQLGVSVHPCNRLDRLTSGLMFLAKTPAGADHMANQLKAREVKKEYIARVVGEFPIESVVVEKALRCVEPRLALNAVCDAEDEGAKEAKTVFTRVSFDGTTSLVKCQPHTGRTHQIRVHLQYLGHPIANDPLYSNPQVWGPTLGKGQIRDFSSIISKLSQVGKTVCAESWYHPDSKGELLTGEKCAQCETDFYTDPGSNDLDLWLHAYCYESTEFKDDGLRLWSYKTQFPDWAVEPHRQYMEMAVREAQKCGPTDTAFSVGAVLVNGNTVLAVGHSRELPGNTHAEQCALEKYCSQTNLEFVTPGTVIYTTMEPCSLRLSGQKPCVDRILEQAGNIRTVFVGVMEPDTFVKRNTSKARLSQQDIDYVFIPGYEEVCTEAAFKGHENH